MSGKRCTIEYDGASKGNPGRSGGGVVIRSDDGSTIRFREGLGSGTNNAVEYQPLNIDLQVARDHHGFEHVTVRGDSGKYQARNPSLRRVHNQITGKYQASLRTDFKSFTSQHAPRGYNRDADREANLGGQYEVDYDSEDSEY